MRNSQGKIVIINFPGTIADCRVSGALDPPFEEWMELWIQNNPTKLHPANKQRNVSKRKTRKRRGKTAGGVDDDLSEYPADMLEADSEDTQIQAYSPRVRNAPARRQLPTRQSRLRAPHFALAETSTKLDDSDDSPILPGSLPLRMPINSNSRRGEGASPYRDADPPYETEPQNDTASAAPKTALQKAKGIPSPYVAEANHIPSSRKLFAREKQDMSPIVTRSPMDECETVDPFSGTMHTKHNIDSLRLLHTQPLSGARPPFGTDMPIDWFMNSSHVPDAGLDKSDPASRDLDTYSARYFPLFSQRDQMLSFRNMNSSTPTPSMQYGEKNQGTDLANLHLLTQASLLLAQSSGSFVGPSNPPGGQSPSNTTSAPSLSEATDGSPATPNPPDFAKAPTMAAAAATTNLAAVGSTPPAPHLSSADRELSSAVGNATNIFAAMGMLPFFQQRGQNVPFSAVFPYTYLYNNLMPRLGDVKMSVPPTKAHHPIWDGQSAATGAISAQPFVQNISLNAQIVPKQPELTDTEGAAAVAIEKSSADSCASGLRRLAEAISLLSSEAHDGFGHGTDKDSGMVNVNATTTVAHADRMQQESLLSGPHTEGGIPAMNVAVIQENSVGGNTLENTEPSAKMDVDSNQLREIRGYLCNRLVEEFRSIEEETGVSLVSLLHGHVDPSEPLLGELAISQPNLPVEPKLEIDPTILTASNTTQPMQKTSVGKDSQEDGQTLATDINNAQKMHFSPIGEQSLSIAGSSSAEQDTASNSSSISGANSSILAGLDSLQSTAQYMLSGVTRTPKRRRLLDSQVTAAKKIAQRARTIIDKYTALSQEMNTLLTNFRKAYDEPTPKYTPAMSSPELASNAQSSSSRPIVGAKALFALDPWPPRIPAPPITAPGNNGNPLSQAVVRSAPKADALVQRGSEDNLARAPTIAADYANNGSSGAATASAAVPTNQGVVSWDLTQVRLMSVPKEKSNTKSQLPSTGAVTPGSPIDRGATPSGITVPSATVANAAHMESTLATSLRPSMQGGLSTSSVELDSPNAETSPSISEQYTLPEQDAKAELPLSAQTMPLLVVADSSC